MERKEAIRGAYRMTGENNFYDGMFMKRQFFSHRPMRRFPV